VQISEIIATTVNLVKTQYDDIELVTSKDFDPKITCFPAKLAQVLMNLTVNACHAIESRKESNALLVGRITISTDKVGSELLIKVQDNGNGMSETTKDKIFEPFFTTKSVGKGTGLGMAISFGIIEEHGGHIEIESAINKGSDIMIFLPLN
jgi:signal transduction histidine kinase